MPTFFDRDLGTDAHADRCADVSTVDRHIREDVVGAELVRLGEDLGGADEVEHLDAVEEQNADVSGSGSGHGVLRVLCLKSRYSWPIAGDDPSEHDSILELAVNQSWVSHSTRGRTWMEAQHFIGRAEDTMGSCVNADFVRGESR